MVGEGQVLSNRYKLLSLEGEGGMAAVYKAQDLKLKRTVAVKVLQQRIQFAGQKDVDHNNEFSGLSDELQREAQAAAGAPHPNIVTVYDIGQDGDVQYIVMEYVQGPTLHELIESEAPFSVGRALDIAVQICAAAEFIHGQGTLHCDLKPQNLLILADGRVKVTDFGIARALSAASPAQRSKIWGTPYYASPELIAGRPLTPASDVYAIGLILYEMLAGVRPFEGQSAAEIARQQVLNAPRPIQDHNPRVPRYVRQVIDHALAKDPARRYKTAAQLSQALRRYREHGEAITRPLPPVPEAGSMPVQASLAGPGEVPSTTTNSMAVQGTAQSAAAGIRAVVASAGEPTGGVDWLMWILAGLALIAVLGLVPIWGTVVRRAVAPRTTPTVSFTSLATPTPTTDTGAVSPPTTPTATPEARVSAPDLVGQKVEAARQLAQEKGLALAILEQRHDAQVPEAHVILQSIAAGEQVLAGSEIGVVVSLGPPVVTMPDIVGFPAAVKRLDLEDLGLTVAVTETWSAEPAGLVIAQAPPAGAEILAGSTVTLTVSGGLHGEVRANLDYKVSLVACELNQAAFRPGDVVQLVLTWQALGAMSESYMVFIHITRPDGRIVTQRDAPPLGGNRPTDTWRPGEAFRDMHTLVLPSDTPLGTYWVRVGLYRGDRRLPVVDPGLARAEDNALIVHQIEVK